MKRDLLAVLYVVCVVLGVGQAQAQFTNRVSYTLLPDSYFVDDCQICGRPTIQVPLRGTFDLVLLQNTAPYTKYAIQNIRFVAGQATSFEKQITGEGTYERFEEVAILQDMDLAVQIKDSFTNRPAFFTNETRSVQKQFPVIEADPQQTNGTLIQTFSLHILAAPFREIWFSTSRGFTSTNRLAPTNQINAGDLISNRGRVVKRNIDLVGRLGVMPSVPDLGLDAVTVTRRGEILFSIPVDVFSETLGPIQHGDLLSNRGAIVRRNQQLLAAFHPASTNDAGLDAVQVMPDGEILFSVRTNVAVNSNLVLSGGDILSDRGQMFRTQQQLLANFHPAVTNRNFGLDAVYVFTTGEIWFSVQEGFTDNQLGVIQEGDLLSNFGYRVFSNQELLLAFQPADPAKDYGLDALYVITDTHSSSPPPRIMRQILSGGSISFEWDGSGEVFQLESAARPDGPWEPCSPIMPDSSWEASDPAHAGSSFYRLRQW